MGHRAFADFRVETHADRGWAFIHQCNANVCIKQRPQSKYLRMGGFLCLPLAGKSPPALSRSNSSNHLWTSLTIGSRRTPSFTRRTRTRSPSKRNSLGRRTALLRPVRNSFATLLLAITKVYINGIYQAIRARFEAR